MLYLHVTQDGHTALIVAAAEGHTECLRALMASGADKEAKGNVRGRPWFAVLVCKLIV